jgi:hypothetical protein
MLKGQPGNLPSVPMQKCLRLRSADATMYSRNICPHASFSDCNTSPAARSATISTASRNTTRSPDTAPRPDHASPAKSFSPAPTARAPSSASPPESADRALQRARPSSSTDGSVAKARANPPVASAHLKAATDTASRNSSKSYPAQLHTSAQPVCRNLASASRQLQRHPCISLDVICGNSPASWITYPMRAAVRSQYLNDLQDYSQPAHYPWSASPAHSPYAAALSCLSHSGPAKLSSSLLPPQRDVAKKRPPAPAGVKLTSRTRRQPGWPSKLSVGRLRRYPSTASVLRS